MAATLLLRIQPLRFSRVFRNTYRLAVAVRHQSTTSEQSPLKSFFVSPAELHDALQHNAPSSVSTDPRVITVCGSWFMPNDPQKRTGLSVFRQGHIQDARFFDLDKISDASSPYPHMLPSPEVFQEAMCDLGINRQDTVVVYDSAELGIFSSPRVAWTFRVFGHPTVHILNNFKLWKEQKYPVQEGEQKPFSRTKYEMPTLDKSKVVDYEEVKTAAADYNKEGREEVQILDARSTGRWKGTDPEPRPGLSSGHMPGSISIPFTDLLDPATKAMLSPEQLRKVFDQKGVDPDKPIISSCGTGVTAAVIDTALVEAGYDRGKRQLYDGSWTEWAQRVQPSDNLIVKEE